MPNKASRAASAQTDRPSRPVNELLTQLGVCAQEERFEDALAVIKKFPDWVGENARDVDLTAARAALNGFRNMEDHRAKAPESHRQAQAMEAAALDCEPLAAAIGDALRQDPTAFENALHARVSYKLCLLAAKSLDPAERAKALLELARNTAWKVAWRGFETLRQIAKQFEPSEWLDEAGQRAILDSWAMPRMLGLNSSGEEERALREGLEAMESIGLVDPLHYMDAASAVCGHQRARMPVSAICARILIARAPQAKAWQWSALEMKMQETIAMAIEAGGVPIPETRALWARAEECVKARKEVVDLAAAAGAGQKTKGRSGGDSAQGDPERRAPRL
jgi:hypothetical protein